MSARRTRQTTTRERALENQIHRLCERVRELERRLDEVILDAETDNAVHALRKAVGHPRSQDTKTRIKLVSGEKSREG